jgi:TPR repeat protein/peptidoglycan hydrolase-like protein with peptidoglycan-binding domain
MTGRPDWRSSALLATTVVGIACAALVAFITIDPPPLPARRAKASSVTAPPVHMAEVKLPEAEPPPPPNTADFSAKPAEPAAPPASAKSEPAKAEPAKVEPATPEAAIDWPSLPIEEVRTRANTNDLAAMEELARRLIQGAGVAKDPQAGAGWLLRAAEAGSAQAAFNVGVMYERGFVVERDSSRAVEWYRKAAEGNMPAAKHNLALLLRDGKGAPRDAKRAIELLQSAARQGMAASMFSLGDMYERGDAGVRDPAAALAWFAIAAEFERQINRGDDTPLAKSADQRAQALQGVLTPVDLKRAQQMGQAEFHAIAEALAPPKPSSPPTEPAAPASAAEPPPPAAVDLPSWPKAAAEQVRAVQQALVDLRLLRNKPDGVLGPMTRNAIREFQRSVGLKETGEPGKDVYVAMRQAQAKREVEAKSPLPLPAKQEATKNEPVAAKAEAVAAPTTLDLGKPEPPPPPPTTTDIVRALPQSQARPEATKAQPAKPAPAIQPPIKIAAPDPPPPPTSIDIARTIAKTDPNAWPPDSGDQIKAVQRLLRELKILAEPADGQLGDKTRAAIRDYQRLAGLEETGEPGKALFDSLKETRALMVSRTGSN